MTSLDSNNSPPLTAPSKDPANPVVRTPERSQLIDDPTSKKEWHGAILGVSGRKRLEIGFMTLAMSVLQLAYIGQTLVVRGNQGTDGMPGFGIALLVLRGQPIDDGRFEVLTNIYKISANIWPIIFASTMAAMLKSFASFRLKKGAVANGTFVTVCWLRESPPGSTNPNFTINIMGTVAIDSTVYAVDAGRLAVVFLASAVLLVAAVVSTALPAANTAPDVLGYVGGLARDNPHAAAVPAGLSALPALDGTDFAADVRLRLADVGTAEGRRHIALTTGEGQPLKVGRQYW